MKRWKLAIAARRSMYRLLQVVERFPRRPYELRFPPTFIVGPARSGTTVTRQVVSWGLTTCHFTNLMGESFRLLGRPLPYTTARMVHLFCGSPPTDDHYEAAPFQSRFGQIRGKSAPAEGEQIWGHYFGTKYDAVAAKTLTPTQIEKMYRAVADTERVFRLPFVNKTCSLNLRIEALVRIFPRAIFILVSRDLADTAQSIFRARQTDYPDWFGGRPPECDEISGEALSHQVCKQVFYVREHLERQRRAVGNDRFLEVRYRDVCERPRSELARIATFMNEHGAPVEPFREIPESFPFSHGQKLADEDYGAIRDCLEQLERRSQRQRLRSA